jgi:quinol-cytochrome oxidoreductase complex cytochrome b subunit
MPWLDTSKVRSGRFRPLFQIFFWVLVGDAIFLGYVGGNPPEEPLLTWGRVATFWYFFHFHVIIPVLGLIEKPRKVPESIAAAVLPADAVPAKP